MEHSVGIKDLKLVFDGKTIYEPLPQQRKFHMSTAKYRLLGGAVGGGKTIGIIGEALMRSMKYDFPLTGAIFRRSYPELEATIIRTMLNILPQWFYKYNQQQHLMTLKNGSMIEFCYAESDNDVIRYQSREWDWVAIDEITHFCLVPETEVLTQGGWKKITDILGDEVLTLCEDGKFKWNRVLLLNVFPYKGIMKYLRQRKGVSFCVTPNHKQVIEREKYWEYIETKDLPCSSLLKRGGVWRGKVVLYKNFKHSFKGHNEVKRVSMKDWCEFLGWYLSEGYSFCMRGDKSPVVGIRQMKRVEPIESLLDRLGWRWKYNEDGKYQIFSRQLYEEVHPLGNLYQKRVPRNILMLSSSYLKILLQAFLLGDGHHVEGGHEENNNTALANEGLIDDLQEICLKVGLVGTKGYQLVQGKFPIWRLSISKRKKKSIQVNSLDIKDIDYEGLVYCPTVENNHNFVMRYNGRVMVTGNSEFQFTYLMSRMRTVKPINTKFFAATNPGGRGHNFVKERWISKTCKNENYKPEEYDFIPAGIMDNPYLMKNNPDYIENLKMLPEKERKALLEGNWDIFEGIFFPEWNFGKHVVDEFTVPEDWTLIMGWDDGTREPRAVYIGAIDSDQRVWIIWEYYKAGENLTQAAENIRAQLKENGMWGRISKCVVDPSMKREDSQTGINSVEVLENMGFGFKIGNVELGNNDRVEGWRIMKSYLSHKPYEEPMLKFFRGCFNIIRTLPQLIYYQPRSGASSKKEDLDCFIAGTKIDTLFGKKNIEDIKLGDFVRTPIGYKRVIKDGISGTSHGTSWVKLSNGKRLEGTFDHKIFVKDKGLVKLQDLTVGDILEVKNTFLWKQKKSGTKEYFIVGTPLVGIITRMGTIFGKVIPLCIGKCILITMERFQRVWQSIIKMVIKITTKFPTLNLWITKCTANYTSKIEKTSRKNYRLGEALKRVKKYLERMQEKCTKEPQRNGERANIVKSLLKHSRKTLSFAQKSANILEGLKNSPLKNVSFVEKALQHLIKGLEPVRIVAVGNCEGEKIVYNLTVEGAHLYYANGVLVTNTTQEDHGPDAVRYLLMSLDRLPSRFESNPFLQIKRRKYSPKSRY